jgi:predicted acyltransferase (DUF342 family)
MVFDRSLCYIPSETLIEEKNIRCKGDIILSDRCQFTRGVITEGRVFMGEYIDIKGDVISIGDIRIDRGARIRGDITGDSDIFIGERCKVMGELNVGKDLDIGEGVEIDPETIDSKGVINIRNPISVLLYLLMYLIELLKKDDSEEIDKFFDEFENRDDETFLVSGNFAYFPRNSKVDGEGLLIPGNIRIGPKSQIVANIESEGRVEIENEVQLFGDIKAAGDVYIGENAVINGAVKSSGEIIIHHAARIGGDIKGETIQITPDTIVEGTLKGAKGIKMMTEGQNAIEEKIERFEKGMDTIDGIMD